MFTVFPEDRVTQPRYVAAETAPARRLTTGANLSPATSRCPDQIPREPLWHASSHRLGGFLSAASAALREWRRRKNSRAELARLDERMLRDIGLTQFDAEYEINKPFWRV
jgi:uncharacterized protein YjiS (DUF1127 family)